jgi:peptidoglycan-associated lipoprotein
MKIRTRHLSLAVALALAGGCATQSKTDEAPAASSSAASPSSSASSRGTAASSVRGTPGASASARASQPGQPGARSVFYELDKSGLSSEDRKLVESHAQYLRTHPEVKVRVEGNADERGSKEYNLALGQRRAETVSKVMALMGVSDQRVEAVSYGEEKPKAQGHDEQSWSQNRRSDILY